MNAPVVAVDGPAASGKGTISVAVARALGFHLLDSGALYRVVALAALEQKTDLDDEGALVSLAAALHAQFDDGRVWLGGREVTASIRNEACSTAASRVSVHGALRDALLARQRAFRRPPGLVADGRDMGTVVFPDAEVKIFVTASAEERARRRHKQLIEKGIAVNIHRILRDIQERDQRDTARAASPLRPAPDAVVLDTTLLDPPAATAFVLRVCRERGVSAA